MGSAEINPKPDDVNMESKLKYLEFIQNIITRMNSNSFLIKGWVITLLAAVFALTAGLKEYYIHLINYFIIPIFWLLDSIYLSQERQYRRLYDYARGLNPNVIDFNLNASDYKNGKSTNFSSFFSSTLLLFYGSLIVISLTIMSFINV